MSAVSVHGERDFVVRCPDHHDVILSIRRAGLFSRTKIVNHECPRCQGEIWSSHSLDGFSAEQSSFSYDRRSRSTQNASFATTLEPSAPFDDRTTAGGLPTIQEDGDSISPSLMAALIDSAEPGRGQPSNYGTHRVHDGGRSFAGDSSVVGGSIGTRDIREQITGLVHSLLEGHRSGNVENRLEMLCAWSIGDESVRATIAEAGGIYIIVNLLQRCQQRVADVENNEPAPNRTTHESAPRPSLVANDHTTFVAETTIATNSIDDATTIVTYENLDDLDDNMTQGPWVQDAEAASAIPSHAHRSSMTHTTPSRVSGAESVASSQMSFIASRPPTMNAIDRAFGYSPPATASQNAQAVQGQSQNRLDSIRATKRELEQTIQQTMSDLSDQQQEHRNMQNFSSPAPPTMNDIDRAFGHMMASPAPSHTSYAGGSSAARSSGSSQPLSGPAFRSGDASSAAEMYTMPSSYRPSSRSNRHFDGASTTRGDVSTANYIPPEAMDGAMSMAAINATDARVIEKEVRWAVAILSTLAKDAPPGRLDIIQSAGGIETILSAMWRFERDEMVQEHGCSCLYYFASSSTSHYKSLIISFGGISTLLRAMSLFPTTLELQEICCRFVSIIVPHDPVALESLVTLRGTDLVLLAMKMHRVEEKIQEAACGALEAMVKAGQQVYTDVVRSGGMDAVLTAMWQFEGNGTLQRAAISSLGHMCEFDDGNKRLAFEAGALETILAAMQRHRQNVYVQRASVWALSVMTNNYGEAVRRLQEENALSIIRPAEQHNPESAKNLLRNIRLQRYRSRVF